MKVYKYKLLLVLAFTLFFGIGWQTDCDSPKNENGAKMEKDMNNPKGNPDGNVPEKVEPVKSAADAKVIGEGFYSDVKNPFVFVADTKETYAQLQNLAKNLPAADAFDFEKFAVIAAFAGEKNTGGFSVEFEGADGNFSVKVKQPPKGAIVTQVITSPYKIVVAPVNAENGNLILNLSENWTKAAQNYKVADGEIEFSGGITGKQERYKPEGSIKVFRSGEYLTLFFDLQGKTAGKTYQTKDIASGKITNGNFNLPNLRATNLIERPHPSFAVSGTISGEKLSLELKKSDKDFPVNDGYEGSGKIEASKLK